MEPQHRIACESKRLDLTCPIGSTILITNANYGRTVPYAEVCPYSGTARTDCESNHVPMMEKECQNKTSCSVIAGNALFGDTCSGVHKYLNVTFDCEYSSNVSIAGYLYL